MKKHRLESNTLIFFTSDNGGYIHYNGRHKGQISDNGPLRGQKGMLYEGGIRVPAIAWWPGYIQAGSSSNELMLTMDLLPTFLELASGRRPRPSLEPLDGTSMLSVLLHNKKIRSRLVFWKKGDKGAVRDGHWKLIRDRSSTELFDLSKDIGEQENLAEKEPLVVRKLTTAFAAWEKDVAKD